MKKPNIKKSTDYTCTEESEKKKLEEVISGFPYAFSNLISNIAIKANSATIFRILSF